MNSEKLFKILESIQKDASDIYYDLAKDQQYHIKELMNYRDTLTKLVDLLNDVSDKYYKSVKLNYLKLKVKNLLINLLLFLGLPLGLFLPLRIDDIVIYYLIIILSTIKLTYFAPTEKVNSVELKSKVDTLYNTLMNSCSFLDKKLDQELVEVENILNNNTFAERLDNKSYCLIPNEQIEQLLEGKIENIDGHNVLDYPEDYQQGFIYFLQEYLNTDETDLNKLVAKYLNEEGKTLTRTKK